MRQEGANPKRDAAIARVAARQYGVISMQQLYDLGVPASSIKRRVDAGRLHRVHRAVYAVGHARLSDEGRWMAAVLACGDGAVLSHRNAGELWGMLRRARRLSGSGGRGEEAPVHVTVPGTGGRSGHRGIALHRSSTLTTADCTIRDGIPVTKPARTLADLRPVLTEAQWSAAFREAEFLRLPIGDPAERSPIGRAAERRPATGSRTELEALFLAAVRRHRLPRPEVNVKVDRYEVDFLWRQQGLIVEVDGWQSHGTRAVFEADRARDARLKVLGYDVLRFTWRQIQSESRAVAATIRAVLRASP